MWLLAPALLIALAIDLTLSALGGYNLRHDRLLLVALDLAFLAPAVLVTFAVLYATRWIPRVVSLPTRAPWFTVLAAAWGPVALVRLARGGADLEPGAIPLHALAAALLAAVGWLELRRPPGALRVGLAAVMTAAAAVALGFTLSPPPPGHRLLADSAPRSNPRQEPQGPNLLMIVLDTVRADHLGMYGYPRPTSPWLDAFAGRATLFERAVSPSTYTLPSHATLFTGLHPRSHGADLVDTAEGMTLSGLGRLDDVAPVAPLPAEALTLAEILAAAGWRTGAICANSAYLYRGFGLAQGFDTYVDAPGSRTDQRPAGLGLGGRILGAESWLGILLAGNERRYLLASEVNALATEWLEAGGQERFFLFLNYMDAHQPYLPMGRYRRLFPQADGGRATRFTPFRELSDQGRFTERERQLLIDPYDAELRYLDDHLGELFSWMEARNLTDDTLVVIVGDHGESLGEHGRFGHAVSVYESEARVPLLLRLPGQNRPERVSRTVHLVDVAPTILELLGLDLPEGIEGGSLLDPNRPASALVVQLGRYHRSVEELAIYRGPWKLIRSSGAPPELYHVRDDPSESRNEADARPLIVTEMEKDLDRFLEQTQPRFASESAEIDPETLERIRGLGYVGGDDR